MKTIWSLQQFKMPLNDYRNLVLVCKETSPRYGNDRIKVFFSTVVTWGSFMTKLLITILKHLSINDKGYPCFKKLSSSWNLVMKFHLNNFIRNFILFVQLKFHEIPFEREVNGNLSFLGVEVSWQQGKFVTTVFRKPTFSGVYTHFDSFLPTDCKVCMIYALAYQCFKICSNGTRFHEELNLLKHVFLKNGYPLSFIDKCFKMVINKLVIKCPQGTTVEKETLILSLPYLGDVSLQTRTKLTKSFKGILNCYKLQIVIKIQRKLVNVFQFKDCLPFDLVSGVLDKYMCGRCNSFRYYETYRHLKVRSGEHIGILPLAFRKGKPSKESAFRDHLLNCNNVPSFDEFTILAYGHHKYILEIKESLPIKLDRPVLNKNISSAKLFLFDNN